MRALLVSAMVASAVAQERPEVDATPEAIQTSLREGVDILVRSQNKNGSWGGPTRTKGLNIYAPNPGAHHAFRAGASGLALAGLIDSGDQRPETKEAIAKGAAWMEENLPKLRRADQTTTYNVWGHAYGLRAITALHHLATEDTERSKWRALAQVQFDLLYR